MTAQKIFIGIDGGGSRSRLIMQDEMGKLLATGHHGPANIRLSVKKSWQAINQLVHNALTASHLSLDDEKYEFYVSFALAGCECTEACHEFLATPHHFTRIILTSDVYAACVGAHNYQDGMIIIIGTGVVGLAIDQDKHIKVGGWGFPHSDEGGGAWLGLETIRLVFDWLDGRIDKSPLLISTFERFDFDLTKLTSWANTAQSTEFATIAPLVVDYLEEQDYWALQLFQRAADHIQHIAVAIDQQLPNKALPICLFGGIAPHVKPLLNDNILTRIVTRQHSATEGAIMVMQRALKDDKYFNDYESRW